MLTLVLLAVLPAAANERHFTYTYETPVLPKGGAEIEPWTTVRIGREEHYLRFDQRLEFELGVSNKLMTAWYLNFTGLSAVEEGAFVKEFEWKGVSNEWKLKLSDRVADPVGVGAYVEWGVGPDEIELEAKLLLDKQVGKVLIAGNLVGELELEMEPEVDADGEVEVELEPEIVVQADLGIAVLVSDHFSIGLEVREDNIIGGGEFEHATIHAGPTLGFSQGKWWAAVSALPQVIAFGPGVEGGRELHDHEQVEARVLMGFHL